MNKHAALLVFCTLSLLPSLHAVDLATAGPLNSDRPNLTEGVFTVAPGHFQMESTAYGYTRDRAEGVLTETMGIGGTNFKYGINAHTDVELVYDAYLQERSTRAGRQVGWGDVTLRLKYNVSEEQAKGLGWALLPYVKIPTQTKFSNGHWEGGLIVPFNYQVNSVLTAGWMVTGKAVFDETHGDYVALSGHSFTLSLDLEQALGWKGTAIFTDLAGEAGGGPYRAYADTGLTYNFTNDFQIDAVVVFGLTQAAADISVATGFTWRF